MRKPLTLVAAGLIALSGCSAAPTATAPTTPAARQTPATPAAAASADAATVLASVGLNGLSARQAVEKLDQDPTKRPLAFRASVRPDKLILNDGTREASLPLTGENSFYLSIAPYASRTHECYFHSLATCQGELVAKPVHVKIVDAAGAVLVDADATTYANGFVGFWLPANITGTVTVTTDGKTGTVPFATGLEDATCLTTLKLG